jgi:hypothetical protein
VTPSHFLNFRTLPYLPFCAFSVNIELDWGGIQPFGIPGGTHGEFSPYHWTVGPYRHGQCPSPQNTQPYDDKDWPPLSGQSRGVLLLVALAGVFLYFALHPPQTAHPSSPTSPRSALLPVWHLPSFGVFSLRIYTSPPYANHRGRPTKATNPAPAGSVEEVDPRRPSIEGRSSSAPRPVLHRKGRRDFVVHVYGA